MNLEEILNKRRDLENNLQECYNTCKTFPKRLICIYEIIFKSQKQYLNYKENNLFNDNYLKALVKELGEDDKLTENEFIRFIEEKIIKPLDSGHVNLLYHKNGQNFNSIEKTKAKRPFIGGGQVKDDNVQVSINKDNIVVAIKSFSSVHLKKDKEKFEELGRELNEIKCENVIIDIRGNSGGTDEYFENFSIFTSKDVSTEIRYRNLFTNKNEHIPWTGIHGNPNSNNYSIYLLVDENVFSTAEGLAQLAKETKFATVIGSPTAGEGMGLTPLKLQISKDAYNGDGIDMRFPIEAPINDMGDIDYENSYNTIPDVLCGRKDALNKTLEYIRALEEPDMSI